MPYPCHAPTMPFFSRSQHSTAVERRPCCAVALRRTAWHGMASVNQTRPHCVNQMGKTHSKPLAARYGKGNDMGAVWARHAMCDSAFKAYRFLYVPTGLKFNNSTWCPLCVECFVRISEHTATFPLYIINRLIFITEMESVYSAVRTDFLYKADYAWFL